MSIRSSFLIFSLVLLGFVGAQSTRAEGYGDELANRLAGQILLQVEQHGEAWYIDPETTQRYFLGRAADAYALMRMRIAH